MLVVSGGVCVGNARVIEVHGTRGGYWVLWNKEGGEDATRRVVQMVIERRLVMIVKGSDNERCRRRGRDD